MKNSSQLRIVETGNIVIYSGKMLICDPDCTKKYDMTKEDSFEYFTK